MSIEPNPCLSPQDYLALERQDEWKNEYLDGEMTPMPSVSWRHSLIVTNLVAEVSIPRQSRGL